MKVLYTASATVTGEGRNGHGRTSDGLLDVDLASPKELGGAGGATNPEQLFAVGYAACFHSALKVVGRREKVDVDGSTVEAEVGIGPNDGGGFGLQVALTASLPNVDQERRTASWPPHTRSARTRTRPAATSTSRCARSAADPRLRTRRPDAALPGQSPLQQQRGHHGRGGEPQRQHQHLRQREQRQLPPRRGGAAQWTCAGGSPAPGATAASPVHAAAISSTRPTGATSLGPQRVVFSATITAVSATIHHRLPAPVANITSINAQQHPKQNMPWRTPSHQRSGHPAAVVLEQESPRVAARPQTAPGQRGELGGPGQPERPGEDHSLVVVQPVPRLDQGVHPGVAEQRHPRRT